MQYVCKFVCMCASCFILVLLGFLMDIYSFVCFLMREKERAWSFMRGKVGKI